MIKTLHSQHSKIISQSLVNIRKSANLTQRQLAKRLERERSFVANYELGDRRVDLAEFYWICEACQADAAVQASNIMKAFIQLKTEPSSIFQSTNEGK